MVALQITSGQNKPSIMSESDVWNSDSFTLGEFVEMFPRGIPKDRFIEDLIRQKPGRAEKYEKTVLQ